MKSVLYLIVLTSLIISSFLNTIRMGKPPVKEVYLQTSDSMKYEITKSFSEKDLIDLVLKINKEHNAILSFTDLVVNDQEEITGINLKFIDSQIQESTYVTNENRPIDPIIVYKYGDTISGITKRESALEATPDHILERLARQEKEKIERDSLRKVYEAKKIQATKRKPKLQVRSSHTVPQSLLTKEQKELRRLLQKDSLR